VKSPLQAKTWEFLQDKSLVGAAGRVKMAEEQRGPSERTEEEDFAFATKSGMQVQEVLQEALTAYGEAEMLEKKTLKKKIIAGEVLDESERQRLQELKALNRAQKEAESAAKGPLLKKTSVAFSSCTETGTIDDMREAFPVSTCGTEWTKSSDMVMGGVSSAKIFRTTILERSCNLLQGSVSTANNGGFVQMSLDLSNKLTAQGIPETVDASASSGVEIDVFCPRGESYSLHLRTPDCTAAFSSYRASFETKALEFSSVQLPWSAFDGHGPGAEGVPLDPTKLRRLGLLGIGREFDAELAVSGVRFFK